MRHLEERVSDLVDDRLAHDDRDRALGHLAVCGACREAVELERYAKNALRSLADAPPPPGLVDTLLVLASDDGGPLISQRRARHGRAVRALALGTGSTAAVLVLLASLGGSSEPGGSEPAPASVIPPLEQFTVEHARSTGSLPFVQPAPLLLTNVGSPGDGW